MDFVTGQFYTVPCAIVRTDDGRKYAIPVFEHAHADAQFDFPYEHYHIDGRFYMEPRMAHQFQMKDGHTASIIVPTATSPQFLRIEKRSLTCERQSTGLLIPDKPNEKQLSKIVKYDYWYDSFLGRKCAGRRCPHLGTEMLEQDGKLICPMHQLTADCATSRIIPRK